MRLEDALEPAAVARAIVKAAAVARGILLLEAAQCDHDWHAVVQTLLEVRNHAVKCRSEARVVDCAQLGRRTRLSRGGELQRAQPLEDRAPAAGRAAAAAPTARIARWPVLKALAQGRAA
eukprot:scaffold18742_cov106-Isochrysis_galbana.AAC.3